MADVLREGPENWYRNERWSVMIELAFLAKLGRTRGQGPQCLSIQIAHLADTHPEDALRLSQIYFDDWSAPEWDGSVWTSMGRAAAALDRPDAAAAHFLAALDWQEAHPNHDIGAATRFALWVATHQQSHHYARALRALEEYPHPPSIFPLDRFRMHAALAVLRHADGQEDQARAEARQALEEASLKVSGVGRFQTVGVVEEVDPGLMATLKALATGGGASRAT